MWDLNPPYACVTGKCHNLLGEWAKKYKIGVVGVEPTVFLMWQIYSLLPSPLGIHPDIKRLELNSNTHACYTQAK